MSNLREKEINKFTEDDLKKLEYSVNGAKTNSVEVLAPSGDWDSFMAAINNGADAVYLGLGDFNARAKSTYFTRENIAETVRIAHLFNVKVYVTINTLVSDDEMPAFLDLVSTCVEAKVDAYIVQDYGVAFILKQIYPDLIIHASTQMGIHNVEGAKLAKSLGFSRVVLSREVKLEDILAIHNEVDIEIEYFVQGALCVAFSGNCYFSYLNHGESGNRGKCLQLCRLPYTAFDGDTEIGSGYLLSARDLCLLDNLSTLIEAGVISLKIEGRLRRAGYVATAVSTYRHAVDSLTTHKKLDVAAEKMKLRQVFSRGDFNYNAYLAPGVPDNIINTQNQNHLGLPIGKVVKVERFKDLFRVGLKINHELKSGDGLKFLDRENREVDSLGVGNVERAGGLYYIYTKHRLSEGLDVYLTLNSAFEESVISNLKRIPLYIEFSAEVDEPIKIILQDTMGAKVSYSSDYICSSARTAPTSKEEITSIFTSLEPYFDVKITKLSLGNVFIPKSALKEARRTLIPAIREAIIAEYERHLPSVTQAKSLEDIKLTPHESYFDSIFILNQNSELNSLSVTENDLILFEPELYSREVVTKNLESLGNRFKNVGLVLPVIANSQDCVKLDEIVSTLPDVPLLIENAYGLKYAKTNRLIAGTNMNIYNSYSVENLKRLGVAEFVFSIEQAKTIPSCFELSSGRVPLMHFCHCPFKTLFGGGCQTCKFKDNLTLKNQAGREFSIRRTKISQCYFTLTTNSEIKRDVDKKFIDLRR